LEPRFRHLSVFVDILCFTGHAVVVAFCWVISPIVWLWFKLSEGVPPEDQRDRK
jgi:hypothetical protein